MIKKRPLLARTYQTEFYPDILELMKTVSKEKDRQILDRLERERKAPRRQVMGVLLDECNRRNLKV